MQGDPVCYRKPTWFAKTPYSSLHLPVVFRYNHRRFAGVAELVDAPDSTMGRRRGNPTVAGVKFGEGLRVMPLLIPSQALTV
jgi:hypothetical protein